jgi:hypothetical protein
MKQISSNITLALRIFIPVVWFTFFGALLIVTAVSSDSINGALPTKAILMVASSLLFLGIVLFSLTLWKLYRVDTDSQYIYVTNYFKTVRWTPDSVSELRVKKVWFLHFATLVLNAKGTFGKKIHFIPSMTRLMTLQKMIPPAPVQLF